MKKFIALLLILSAVLPFTYAQSKYRFDHGPYLQDMATDHCAVVFTTSGKGFSWVELRSPENKNESAPLRFYDITDGIRMSDNTFNSIFITGLDPATRYQYRLVSKEITNFVTSFIEFGDSICSPWYDFSTLDPAASGCSFFAASDIHEDTAKLERLLKLGDVQTCDMVFYVGDMQGHVTPQMEPFGSFLDKSVEMFATEKPFWFVRGNHETRGNMAPYYKKYFPSRAGTFYRTLTYGNIMFIMLDCGEDKADDHKYYAGMNDFDSYRTRQAEWLRQVVSSKEYRESKYHILLMHFPPAGSDRSVPEVDAEHGITDVADKWLDILNAADIDFAIVGHMHVFADIPARPGANHFPILLGSNDSAARVDIDENGITIKAFDSAGNILIDKRITK